MLSILLEIRSIVPKIGEYDSNAQMFNEQFIKLLLYFSDQLDLFVNSLVIFRTRQLNVFSVKLCKASAEGTSDGALS